MSAWPLCMEVVGDNWNVVSHDKPRGILIKDGRIIFKESLSMGNSKYNKGTQSAELLGQS